MRRKILLGIFVFVTFLYLLGSNDSTKEISKTINIVEKTDNNKAEEVINTKQIVKPNPYTTSLNRLENTIIDKDKNLSAVFVQYTIARIVDNDPKIYEYPFYATKNRKGDGYIGIMDTNLGKAIFLIPSYEALNITDKSKLESLVKAVNGTAKNLNQNIDFATGYDYLEVMEWIE
ncbi:hypothetical protein KKH36_00465 [Patescibacteria group bacterium]|nr:hypothetical protein [Patescibacteria group bacterium]